MADEIGELGVVGAGFMGSGIAESAARAGVAVTLYEPEDAPLHQSRGRIEASVARVVERGRLSEEDAAALVERIEWSSDLEALSGSDLVVEAIVEDAEEGARVQGARRGPAA